jgi:hypothetical protein
MDFPFSATHLEDFKTFPSLKELTFGESKISTKKYIKKKQTKPACSFIM